MLKYAVAETSLLINCKDGNDNPNSKGKSFENSIKDYYLGRLEEKLLSKRPIDILGGQIEAEIEDIPI